MDPTALSGINDDAGVVAIVILVAQIVGRAIPDNVGGLLGAVRRISKIVGLYVSGPSQSSEVNNDSSSGLTGSSEPSLDTCLDCPYDPARRQKSGNPTATKKGN